MRNVALLLALLVAPTALADALAPLPAESWNRAAAAHLMRRAGFGGTPEQVRALEAIGPDAAVVYLVDYEKQAVGRPLVMDPEKLEGPVLDREIRGRIDRLRQQIKRFQQQQMRQRGQDPARADDPGPTRQRQMQAENQAVNQVFNQYDRRRLQQMRSWWLARMVRTKRPLEEKMTLFWHGHFTSGYESVYNAELMHRQNEMFRKHATGDFGALCRAVVRDGAMLRYLDGARNIKQNPNENFARELLELFTLGRGHYTEQDVKQAARAMTGWRVDGGTSVTYNRYLHDYGSKTFLGKTGQFGADDVISMILEQEQASRWLATKLARFFVSDTPDAKLIEGLALALRESKFQLKPALRRLFRSAAFYAPAVVGRKIKSPAELVVDTIRATGLPIQSVALAESLMSQMGQVLFQPPNVKGWDGGASWINASTLLVRYNVFLKMVDHSRWIARNQQARTNWLNALPPSIRGGAKVKNWGYDELLFLPILRRFDNAKSAEQALDDMLEMLLPAPLAASRKAPLLKILQGRAFDPGSHGTRARLLSVLQLVLGMPEFQLG